MFAVDTRSIKRDPLDPEMLRTPFEIRTNWHVITGTVSSGKSTMINMLMEHGYRTVPESARMYIEREMNRGREIDEIHRDGIALQRGMSALQLQMESVLDPSELVFLDRAFPDLLAWYRVRGMDPNEILKDCFHHRYAAVWMLDPLPFEPDVQRVAEIEAIAAALSAWHARDYEALGYEVFRVPVLAPSDRLDYILERVF